MHWGEARRGREKALNEPTRSSQEWWPSVLDTLAPMTHYGLAPHAPLSSSLTPVQQFSILLLQFIYCPEQTLFLLLVNILLTSSAWKSPFFSLFSCFTVAQDQLFWRTGISPLSEHHGSFSWPVFIRHEPTSNMLLFVLCLISFNRLRSLKPGSVSLLFLCVTCSSCSVNVCLVAYENPIHLQKKAKSLRETIRNRRGKDRKRQKK